jgi:phenylpyruvate tautomerase PptA (4-oxalocrotonate tautomerase family)
LEDRLPQIIIHAAASLTPNNKSELVQRIRESIPQILNVADHIGQVVLYETREECRSTHPTRDKRFIIVEVSMYPGRTVEMKQNFLQNLVKLINRYTGVAPTDINCLIHEIPPDNYFGGVSHEHIEKPKQSNNASSPSAARGRLRPRRGV